MVHSIKDLVELAFEEVPRLLNQIPLTLNITTYSRSTNNFESDLEQESNS
jgi:hypothetical protein